MVDADAGKGQTGLALCVDTAVRGQVEIAGGMLGRIVHQQQPGARRGQARRHVSGRGGIPVAPDVAIDDQERVIAQQRKCLGDAAGGFQGGLLG
ncbi:hypothetical protein D3C72_1916490 [compost metagenome]